LFHPEDVLNANDKAEFPYKHAAISPETDTSIKSALSKVLKSKGFIVYTATAFRNVIRIKQGNPVAIFVCKDAGTTDRGAGSWSQAVECISYDLHSNEILYEGIGEYMGLSAADDFIGATNSALKNFPRVGNQGTITSKIELPHKDIKGSRTYRGRKLHKGKGSTGTGWMTPAGYIVTNYHVIEGAVEIKVISYNGTHHEATIYKGDKVNDIALLDIKAENFEYPSIPIFKESASIGTDVFTLGFPMTDIMGTEVKFTSGKINSLSGAENDPRFYQISVPVQSGNSGGPLINTKGEAVGIVTSKLNAVAVFQWTGTLPENVNYAIKTFYIIPLLDHQANKKVSTLPSKEDSYENLVQRLKKSIFRVVAK
jgi:S1-C subfamily serine protease